MEEQFLLTIRAHPSPDTYGDFTDSDRVTAGLGADRGHCFVVLQCNHVCNSVVHGGSVYRVVILGEGRYKVGDFPQNSTKVAPI